MCHLVHAFGILFAMLLDISVGAAGVHFLAYIFKYDLSWWHYFIGMGIALAPDIDCVWQVASSWLSRTIAKRKNKRIGWHLLLLQKLCSEKTEDDHHQYLPHRPIFGLPLSALFGFVGGGSFWALTATLLVFWHYIHDTKGFCGRGIAWIWPFSKYYYGISWHLSWPPIRIKKTLSWKYSPNHNGYNGELRELYDMYFDPTPQSLTEIIAVMLIWGILALFLWGVLAGVAAVLIIGTAVLVFWKIAPQYKKETIIIYTEENRAP